MSRAAVSVDSLYQIIRISEQFDAFSKSIVITSNYSDFRTILRIFEINCNYIKLFGFQNNFTHFRNQL